MIELAIVGMALIVAATAVSVLWVCLKNYPSISKSEVHRWVHEVHTEMAIKERDAGKVRQLAEKTAWETEGVTQQENLFERPAEVSVDEWDAAVDLASQSGVNPSVALRKMREEAAVFSPTI